VLQNLVVVGAKGVDSLVRSLNLLPLSGHSGHGRTCCRPDPVANGPEAEVDIGGIFRNMPPYKYVGEMVGSNSLLGTFP
jgi:hypothetical protein